MSGVTKVILTSVVGCLLIAAKANAASPVREEFQTYGEAVQGWWEGQGWS